MSCLPAASPYGPVISARKLRRRITAALAVFKAAGTLAACGRSRASTAITVEKPDLTVAAVPAAGAAGLYIAQQNRYFAAAGAAREDRARRQRQRALLAPGGTVGFSWGLARTGGGNR